MYFIFYPQCDKCQWPEISDIEGVKLCKSFEDIVRSRGDADLMPSPADLAHWRCLGLHTFVRASGADYEIWMQRDCLHFSPKRALHVCRHCKDQGAKLTHAFDNSPHHIKQFPDDSSLDSLRYGPIEQSTTPEEMLRQVAGFDPAELDAETSIHWERLMGLAPTRWFPSVSKAELFAVEPPVQLP